MRRLLLLVCSRRHCDAERLLLTFRQLRQTQTLARPALPTPSIRSPGLVRTAVSSPEASPRAPSPVAKSTVRWHDGGPHENLLRMAQRAQRVP